MKKWWIKLQLRRAMKENKINEGIIDYIRNENEPENLVPFLENALVRKLDKFSSCMLNCHPQLLKDEKIQKTISNLLKGEATEYLLKLPYGNKLPNGEELLQQAAYRNKKDLVISLLKNNIIINKNTFQTLYSFFFSSYNWKDEEVEKWKSIHQLLLSKKENLSEDAKKEMNRSCIDLIDCKKIKKVSDLMDLHFSIQEVQNGICRSVSLMAIKKEEEIRIALRAMKRLNKNEEWIDELWKHSILLKKSIVLKVLVEVFPEIMEDPKNLYKFLPIIPSEHERMAKVLKESGISLNEAKGMNKLLENMRFDSTFHMPQILFLLRNGVEMWDGEREEFGIKLVEYLEGSATSKVMGRWRYRGESKEIEEILEANEDKLGKIMAKKYRIFMFQYRILG